MISRNTALVLALAAVRHAAADANVAAGAGVYANSDNAKALYAKAVSIDGDYILTSEATGKTLTYKHDSQPNMYPAADTVEQILETLAGIDDAVVSQHFGIESDSSDNAIRIRFNDGDKCMSAQWNFDWGIDTYGVAYECAVGSGAESDTGLRDAKQWYLAIPVDDSSSSSSSSSSGSSGSSSGSQTGSETGSGSSSGLGSSGDSGNSSPKSSPSSSASSSSSTGIPCEKSPYWVYSHPVDQHKDFYDVHPECVGTGKPYPCDHDSTWLHAHSGYLDDHPWCQATYDAGSKRDLEHGARPHHLRRMSKHAEAKRGDVLGRFYLVLTDHIDDMKTRAITAQDTTAFADAQGAWIALFDESDDDQIWTFTKA